MSICQAFLRTPYGTAVDLATDRGSPASNNLYKLNNDSGMKIYSTQSNGSLQDTTHALLSDLPSAQGMDLDANNLNVAAGTNGLVSIDISDPAHPFANNSAALTANVINVDATDSYAYLAAGLGGVRVVSTAAWNEVAAYSPSGWEITDLALRTRTENSNTVTDIYMGKNNGVVAVTFTPPATIAPLSASPTTSRVNKIHIPPTRPGSTSSYAYIATDTDFKVLLITDPVSGPPSTPASISILGAYPAVPRAILGFDIENSFLKAYAYLCADGGMDIVDISAPAAITLLGHYPMACQALDVVGNRAFVLSTDRVSVFDISDRGDPKRIGFYTLNGIAKDILAYKPAGTPYTYIYASDLLYGVWVLRFSEHTYLPVVMR